VPSDTPVAPESHAALVAALSGRYLLERELGRGGMAVVYLARDLRHERPVALKVILPAASGELNAGRFDREIRVTAALQHPNILPVFDSGRTAGHSWYTMPYVAGETLRRRLEREGPLPLAEAVRLAREIAEALASAHTHGVVHRDVKPENVLLSAGHALVADFGVASVMGPLDAGLTLAGTAVGSPAYMSPEQAAGDAVDGRSDIYALGCVLFEMLAGRPPFTGRTAMALMSRRLAEPAPDVRPLRPEVPTWLETALGRALARDPADRFPTAAAFAEALAAPLGQAEPAAARGPESRETTLVEREELLETLERLLVGAVAGVGATVLVSGEAGIGKTALVEQFTRGARAVRVLWGWCEALFTPRPLGPLHDIAAELGGPLDAALRGGASRETIFSALLDEFGPGRVPAILVLEDLHWADEATLDLVKFLGRRAHRLPLLVIVTSRADEVGPAHPLRSVLGDLPRGAVQRVELRPLSVAAVESLARRAGRSPRGLHAATGGNPFYVSEVLATSQPGIPATVRDAVLGRATRLSASAREALETISAIPGRAEPWLVERLLGRDSAAVDECLAAGMLTSDPHGVGFRHELARRAVDESLAQSRCRGLHARVLAALGAAPFPVAPARLVHHAEGAVDAGSVQRYVPLAAAQASALGAHREAAAHYAVGLRFADGLPQEARAALLEGRSYEEYLYGRMAEATDAREEALATWRRLGDRRCEGAALRWLSRLAWSSGRRRDAERYAAEAVNVLEPLGVSPELAMAYSNLSQLHMLAAEIADAVAWGNKAIAMAEELGDGETLVHALTNVGTAESLSHPDEGYAKLRRALRLAREGGFQEHVARCYANFTSFVADRRYEEARVYLQEGLEYTEARDLDFWTAYLRSWRAQLQFDTGAWDDAERDALGLLERAETVPMARINALCVLGRIRTARGEPGAAALLDEAKVLAERAAELQRLGPVAIARAEAAWLAGDLPRVAAEARPAYELSLGKDNPWIRGVLAVWLHRAGALARAPDGIPRACALEIAGDADGAAAEWGRLGCPYERGLALAQGPATAAVRVLEGIGAAGVVRVVRERIEGSGLRGERRASGGSPPTN
jgi:tetratricopeptide (TPR) repeat protein